VNRTTLLSALLMAAGLLAGPAMAAKQAEIQLQATIGPLINVSSVTQNVELSNNGSGNITGLLDFQLNCNVSTIGLELLVTHLYLNGDPSSSDMIPVDNAAGIELHLSAAQPINGSQLVTGYATTAEFNKDNGAFGAYKTGRIDVESTQDNELLHQTVGISASWLHDGDMPSGTYTGYAVLYISML